MLSKTLLKKISAFLAAAMLLSCSAAFAEPVADTPTTEEGEQQTPQTVDVNISVNYFQDEDNSNAYKIIISSLDSLKSYKNFAFSVSVPESQRANVTITSAQFGDSLKTGAFSVGSEGTYKYNFSKGSETTLIGGKLTLCTVFIESNAAPSAETIVFDAFTATNESDEPVTFNPTVTYEAGPVVPELTEEEQNAYDLIVALPSADTLSFYDESSNLISLDELDETVTETKDAYNALSSDEKANVDAVLLYNEKTKDSLTALPAILTAMKNVYPILKMEKALPAADAGNIKNYQFMTNVYSSVIGGISATGLPADSLLKTQFTDAKTSIETKKSAIDTAVSEISDYLAKIDHVDAQLPVIQTLNNDKYYDEYLDNLLTQTETLIDDIEDNYSGPTKNSLLDTLDDIKFEVETIINGVENLPTFTMPDRITQNTNYTVTVSRSSANAVEAKIKIVVYDKNDDEIDEDEFNFAAGKKSLECTMSASKKYYPANQKITVKVYYIVSSAEFFIGEKEVECRTAYVQTGGVTGGGYTSNKGSNGSDLKKDDDDDEKDKNSTGGTKYPSGDPDDYKDNDSADSEEIFNDIDNYGWAKEAIEGLYYTGIINGMEEGVFNPKGNVTREQFCKMVVQLFEVLDYDTETSFGDVNPDAWYAPYIASAIKAGYVQGESDEYFGVGVSIMRQDMATILFRALGSKGKATVLDFTDNESIAPYAQDAVAELVGLGVINGYEDGSFKARGTATRAEAAKVIWGVYQILND